MKKTDFPIPDEQLLAQVAVVPGGENRSGTFILNNHLEVCSFSRSEGLELISITKALDTYPWLRKEHYHPQGTDEGRPEGFFLRVKEGMKITLPSQAALCMTASIDRQVLHNVIILEDEASLEFITGCVSGFDLAEGDHLAVTETYVGKGAEFTHTMVHSWGPGIRVFPRSTTLVEEGGRYVSNYVSLRSGRSVESSPVTYLNGPGASAKYASIILGSKGTTLTLGGDVYLNAPGTGAEIAHRAVCTGGKIVQKGLLIGNEACHAHVDCAGMIIDAGEDGFIESIPGLQSRHPSAHMSHEASIGKISPHQVQYLMAQGLEEREAVSMIIRGFLDTGIRGLGDELERRIEEIAELAGHGEE
ncbi:MAG: SufD family Fe-S cluster assembly protein [Spirochaetales bacterium]|nr:SufD family Fe-S cluster assembly protein [Spirochaetales bacterium]